MPLDIAIISANILDISRKLESIMEFELTESWAIISLEYFTENLLGKNTFGLQIIPIASPSMWFQKKIPKWPNFSLCKFRVSKY